MVFDSPDAWSYVTNSLSINNDQYLRFSQTKPKKLQVKKKRRTTTNNVTMDTEMNVYDYLDELCNSVILMENEKAKLIAKAQEIDLVNTLEILTLEAIMRKVRVQHSINKLNAIIDGTYDLTSNNQDKEQYFDAKEMADLDSDLYELSRMPVELEVLGADRYKTEVDNESSKLEELKLLENVGKVSSFRINAKGSDDSLRLCFCQTNNVDDTDDIDLLFGEATDLYQSKDFEYGLVIGECTKNCEKYELTDKKGVHFFKTMNIPEVKITIDLHEDIPDKQKTLLNVLLSSTKVIKCNKARITPLLGTFLGCFQFMTNNRLAQFSNVDFRLSKDEFGTLLRRLPIDELEIFSKSVPILDDKIALLLPAKFCINVDRLSACIGLTDLTLRYWLHGPPSRLGFHNIKGSFTVEAICKLIEAALVNSTVLSDQFVWCFTLSAIDRTTVKSFVQSTFVTTIESREALRVCNRETGRSMQLLLYKLEFRMELQAHDEAEVKDFQTRCRNGTVSTGRPFHFDNPRPNPYDNVMF